MNCIITKCAKKIFYFHITVLTIYSVMKEHKKIKGVLLQCAFDLDLIKHMTKTYYINRPEVVVENGS